MNVVIYSKAQCKGCKLAKEQLDLFGLDYTEVILEDDDDINALKAKYPEARVVPLIEVDGEMIGSLSQFRDWYGRGDGNEDEGEQVERNVHQGSD